MIRRWLFKTEPTAYAFEQLEREGRTVWEGVKNPLARKHLSVVARNDMVLVYHTGKQKAAVGIARALGGAYADPTSGDAQACVVDLAPVRRLPRPVSLTEIKARPILARSLLVRLPRLSVMPLTEAQWAEIERLSEA